jgi:PDZ domain-containing protein
LLVVLMLIAGGWVAIVKGADGYYAFSPGSAPQITNSAHCQLGAGGSYLLLPDGAPCVLISVPSGRGHPVAGSLYMVDVLVGPATPYEYILQKLHLLHTLKDGTQLYPKGEVLGTTPAAQLPCQDAQEMTGSTSAAAVVALSRLGYPVKEDDLGAELQEVAPGTPAAAAGLQCNDLVIAINGVTIHTASDLVSAVHSAKPGQTVRVTVSRVGSDGKAVTVTIPARLSGTPAISGEPANPHEAFLGVVTFTQSTYSFPFDVSIEVGDIGGPSAGLALTLGLLDILSNGELTGGHRVAATGTISLNGAVGDVGGVAQKAVAVRDAGAQLFLVPPQEYAVAKSEAGSMKIEAVSTLQQALADLQAIGGRIPPAQPSQNGGG